MMTIITKLPLHFNLLSTYYVPDTLLGALHTKYVILQIIEPQ